MSESQWYYLFEGKKYGPYTDDEMIGIFHSASAPGPETLARNAEMTDWVRVSKIEGLTPGAKNVFTLKTKPEWIEPPPLPKPGELKGMTPCPRCGEPYAPQAVICIRCRKKLTIDANIPWDTIGLNATRILVTLFLIWLVMYWFELGPFAPAEPETNRAKPATAPATPAPNAPEGGSGNGLSKPSQSIGIDI